MYSVDYLRKCNGRYVNSSLLLSKLIYSPAVISSYCNEYHDVFVIEFEFCEDEVSSDDKIEECVIFIDKNYGGLEDYDLSDICRQRQFGRLSQTYY